jgi:hypothetical protein
MSMRRMWHSIQVLLRGLYFNKGCILSRHGIVVLLQGIQLYLGLAGDGLSSTVVNFVQTAGYGSRRAVQDLGIS